ncbi:MAG: fumarylacetoacetate hydrolase family protein [Planctomycetes bacterium]|nr:fumarylacetoacetate hydrolase family protein [Planctomycetota bacterium]
MSTLPTPRQALAVGRNYAAHAAELDHELPSTPLLFWKPVGCLVEGRCPLPRWPEGETPIHYEGEVVLVLGRAIGPGTAPLPADPWEAVAGVAPGLDLSDRALQKLEPQWVRAKGFYGAGALGPILPRPADPAAISLRTLLNGAQVQAGCTDQLLFPLRPLLRYLHGFVRLDAGDVIFTGTPAGVGPLTPGDRVAVSVSAAEGEQTLEVEAVRGPEVPAFARD